MFVCMPTQAQCDAGAHSPADEHERPCRLERDGRGGQDAGCHGCRHHPRSVGAGEGPRHHPALGDDGVLDGKSGESHVRPP